VILRLSEEEYRRRMEARKAHRLSRAPTCPPLIGEANGQDRACGATISIPWPPTANTNVRHARGGHFLTAKHKNFRAEVAVLIMGSKPLQGRLAITINAFPPDRRARDLDNLVKPILDALQHGGLYASDSAIDDLRIVRCGIKHKGEVTVTVSKID
jgi:crossover junction endodeoxyribonuclease RusA